jgi:hypothetical protein
MKPNTRGSARVDWKVEREKADLVDVVTRLIGPGKAKGGRLWLSCPLGTHVDENPSFSVTPGRKRWKCFGCGERGDVVDLVMRVRGVDFPTAIAYITGGQPGVVPGLAPTRAAPRPVDRSPPAPGPGGLSEADALGLVSAAEARLWTPEGAEALAYLTGPRCLAPETVRRARLGWVAPGTSGIPWRAPGVLVPWFDGGRLVLAKLRVPDDWRERHREQHTDRTVPKYVQFFADPTRLPIFLGNGPIVMGRPLVVAEGEFDALVLGQALGDAASVVTLGAATGRPDARAFGPMLAAPTWYVATDADPAGDRAAEGWPARARRVRPPGEYKDWTEVGAAGVDLARWWREVFAGVESPKLFTWEELARWRWGGAGPEEENIVVDRPDPVRRMEAMRAALADPDDPEREAIRWETSSIYNY